MSVLLKKYSNETIKFALLQTSYRNDINVTDDLFPSAEKHLYEFYKVFQDAQNAGIRIEGEYPEIDKAFNQAMDDDFNTAKALSDLFGWAKRMRAAIQAGDAEAARIANGVVETYALLGLFTKDPETVIAAYDTKHAVAVPDEVKALAEARFAAKKARDWATADALRAQITALGWAVKDSKEGYILSPIE